MQTKYITNNPFNTNVDFTRSEVNLPIIKNSAAQHSWKGWVYILSSSHLLWSPSITDVDDFLFNVENMKQYEDEESKC